MQISASCFNLLAPWGTIFLFLSETKKNILKEEKIQKKEEIQEKEKKQEKDERSFPQKQKLNKRENTQL